LRGGYRHVAIKQIPKSEFLTLKLANWTYAALLTDAVQPVSCKTVLASAGKRSLTVRAVSIRITIVWCGVGCAFVDIW